MATEQATAPLGTRAQTWVKMAEEGTGKQRKERMQQQLRLLQ